MVLLAVLAWRLRVLVQLRLLLAKRLSVVQLVQEQVRLVKKWLRHVQAQQVSLVRLARLVQRDALQRASQQGPRW